MISSIVESVAGCTYRFDYTRKGGREFGFDYKRNP